MATNADKQRTLGIMEAAPVRFFVPGKPVPGGSKRAFKHPHTGQIILTDMGGKPLVEWRQQVVVSCREVFKEPALMGPLYLTVVFTMPRPKGHYGSGRNEGKLKLNAPHYHVVAPDRTKLLRALEDALTHILWKDDSQVVDGPTSKIYGEHTGALVEVTPL